MMLLNDFRRLSPPPMEAIEKHKEQIRIIINAMGHKYRLARPMPKTIKDKK